MPGGAGTLTREVSRSVVQLRTGQCRGVSVVAGPISTGDQNAAVKQARRRVPASRLEQGSCGGEGPGCPIVQLRGPPDDEHRAVRQ